MKPIFSYGPGRHPAPCFQDFDVIYPSSRAQALEEGVLIDVSAPARQAGFVYPVALSAGLWDDIRRIPEGYSGQSVQGRLEEVLRSARRAIRDCPRGSVLLYQVLLPMGDGPPYTVQLVCGPGDYREPVLTLLRPQEG